MYIKPFTVYYHLLTPMLLNELQKERRRNETRSAEIRVMTDKIADLTAAHKAEMTAQKKEITALRSELESLQATQEHQLQVLAKLAAFVPTSPTGRTLQKESSQITLSAESARFMDSRKVLK